MKLSIVMPVYNEEKTIGEIIGLVNQVDIGLEKELVVVDDCSKDGTRLALESLRGQYPTMRLVFHEQNMGKGRALRTGFAAATGDVILVQDADLEYDPQESSLVIGPIVDGRADVVFGSRFMGGLPHRVVYFWHMVGNRFLTLLSNMLTNLNLTDMETCYKAFRREVLQSLRLTEDRFGIEPEVTARVAQGHYRIFEVGISYYGRTYAEGKKINWKDGMRALYAILRFNLWDR